MELNLLFILILVLPAILVSYVWGTSKHIGFTWSLILLTAGFIPGIIALLASPSAQDEPTKPNVTHKIFGGCFILFGTINAIKFLTEFSISGNLMLDMEFKLGIPLVFLAIGIYLVMLGSGEIINKSPIYVLNQIKTKIELPNEEKNERPAGTDVSKAGFRYWISTENQKLGPFTYEDLQKAGLEPEDLVWRHGFVEWTKAKDVKELTHIVNHEPPPLPNTRDSITTFKIYIGPDSYSIDELKELAMEGHLLISKDQGVMCNGQALRAEEVPELHSYFQRFYPPETYVLRSSYRGSVGFKSKSSKVFWTFKGGPLSLEDLAEDPQTYESTYIWTRGYNGWERLDNSQFVEQFQHIRKNIINEKVERLLKLNKLFLLSVILSFTSFILLFFLFIVHWANLWIVDQREIWLTTLLIATTASVMAGIIHENNSFIYRSLIKKINSYFNVFEGNYLWYPYSKWLCIISCLSLFAFWFTFINRYRF